MKITIEEAGQRLVVTDADLENFSLLTPRDVITNPDGTRELGTHAGFSLTGTFKEFIYPKWEAIDG